MKDEKVCRVCKRFVQGDECPICRDKSFSRAWKGVVIVNDINSEIGQTVGAKSPGKYCIWVR